MAFFDFDDLKDFCKSVRFLENEKMKIEATKEPFDLDRKSTLKKPQIKFEWVDVRRKDVSLPTDVPDPTTHESCLSSQACYS